MAITKGRLVTYGKGIVQMYGEFKLDEIQSIIDQMKKRTTELKKDLSRATK